MHVVCVEVCDDRLAVSSVEDRNDRQMLELSLPALLCGGRYFLHRGAHLDLLEDSCL